MTNTATVAPISADGSNLQNAFDLPTALLALIASQVMNGNRP
jgi:hypothetical protein